MKYETIILIPSYNGAALLNACLSSVRDQNYQNFKTIVIDDASTDNTVEHLRVHFPEVDIVTLSRNGGFARAVNSGLRHVIQKYNPRFIAILNNDTMVDKQWLAFLIKRINIDVHIAAVTSNMFFYDHPEIINSQGGTIDWNGDGYDINFGVSKERGKKESFEVIGACFGAALVRAETFQNIGFLDEVFGAYFEDLDWSWRARLYGYRVFFEPKAIVYHRHSASYNKMPYKKLYFCKRNALRAALKNYERKYLFRSLTYILIGYWFSIVGYFQTSKHRLPFLKKLSFTSIPFLALLWNIIHLSDTLKNRKKIQRERIARDEEIIQLVKLNPAPVRKWLKNLKEKFFTPKKIVQHTILQIVVWFQKIGRKVISLCANLLMHNKFFILMTRFNKTQIKYANKKNQFGVNIFGFLNSESGVGEAARTIARTISQREIPYALLNSSRCPHRKKENEFSKKFSTQNPYSVNIIVFYGDVFENEVRAFGEQRFQNKYNIAYWAWELSSLPASWAAFLESVDEVWTPSSFSKKAIREAKKDIPVTVIPHAITIRKCPYPRKRFGIPDHVFLFLFMFDFYSIFERKNPLAIVRAFKNAFRSDERVALVIKSSNHTIDPENFAKLQRESETHNIFLLNDYLSREEVSSLVNVCDAYVSLHRSEGFGLTIAEAMAFGKPVIATNYSGNTDFLNEENGFPIPYKLITLEKDYGPYQKGNVWAEPDEEKAAEAMRIVYKYPEIAGIKGRKARNDIIEKLNSHAVADVIINRLRQIK